MPRSRTRSLLAALGIAALLAACGGGGEAEPTGPAPPRSGGPSTPNPSAGAATLDRARTRDFAIAAIAELDLQRGDRTYLPAMIARAKSLVANSERPCPGGGSIHEAQSLAPDLTGTIVFGFSDCVDAGVRQSGTMRVRIDAFDRERRAATDYLVTFEKLTFARDEQSTEANGTAALKVRDSQELTTVNATARYAPEGVAIRLENVVITHTALGSGARNVRVSGRLFHSVHGYVDLDTLEEPRVDGEGSATSGTIRITGAQNATADIGFAGGPITLRLDSDANGRHEASLSATWAQLRGTQNLPPTAQAGADVTVAHGATATLDASASGDWDADALAFEWALVNRPSQSRATASSADATLAFTGDVQGSYDLRVTVRDAHGASSTDTVRVTMLAPGTAPPNAKPVANAGSDQATVERQSVLVDGSLSADAENDPLTYLWQLVRAPAGSAVAVNETAVSFTFTPDLPGTYELRLTADDGRGTATDTMRVVADRLLTFASAGNLRIDGASAAGSDRGELMLRTSAQHRGEAVTISLSSDAPWLTLPTASVSSAAAGSAIAVPVQLDLAALATLANGVFEARITAVPAGGQSTANGEVALNLRLPLVRTVMPYVAYAGTASRITLYGEELADANGRSLIVNGTDIPGIAASGNARATVELPALPAGTYTVRISHALDIRREMGRLVVRDAPAHPDTELSLPGAVRSVEYDAERDRFYLVFRSDEGVRLASRMRFEGGAWQLDPIAIANPLAVSLTADGTQLLVTADGCAIHHLDPETLGSLHAATRPGCLPAQPFGNILALGNGRVLLTDDDQNSHVWEYPGFAESDVLPPIINAFSTLSYERNRVLWGEARSDRTLREFFYYDVGSTGARSIDTPSEVLFSRSRLAISGNGARTVHNQAVFDETLRFMGTLAGRAAIAPGLDRRGTRAVVLDLDTDALAAYDVSAGGPDFPQVGADLPLHIDAADGSVVVVPPADKAAFVFVRSEPGWIPGTHPDSYRLYVRAIPGS